jgi:peptide/nickel transport system ATP-binding protein
MDICRREIPMLTTLAPDHRVACFAASPNVHPSIAPEINAAEAVEEERI